MVIQTVRKILSEVLGLDESQTISATDRLVDDLGAESIDFIDICFRLEQEFSLSKVDPGQIFPVFLRNESYLDDAGGIQVGVVDRLRNEFPHLKRGLLNEFLASKTREHFTTVRVLIDFVEHKLS